MVMWAMCFSVTECDGDVGDMSASGSGIGLQTVQQSEQR